MLGCSRVSLEKMTRSRRLQLASVNYSMTCTWQGSNFLSQVVVADKCVLKAARGSWLVCGRDPWQKSVPRLLFVCVSAIKTGRWQIWGWGKTVRGPERNRPGIPTVLSGEQFGTAEVGGPGWGKPWDVRGWGCRSRIQG